MEEGLSEEKGARAMQEKTLKEYGYPMYYAIGIDCGCGDGYEVPQEYFTARTCGSCRRFNKEWVCEKTGEDKDPDNDTCDDIDYEEEAVNNEEYRSPVRCEYDSDKDYKQACKAISRINADIRAEAEHQYNLRVYGQRYWEDC